MFRVVVFRLGVARPRDGDRLQEVTFTLDLKKLTKGEQILGAASLALIILSFLPLWAKVETKLGAEFEDLPGAEAAESSERFNLWDAYGFLAKLAIILALVAIVLIIVRQVVPNLNLPVPAGQLYLGLGGLTLLLMLISILTGPEGDQGSTDFGFGSVEVSRGLIGLLLGLVSAGAMAYGAWLHLSAEGSGTAPSVGPGPTTPPPPAS